jgi:hypothetical protein
MEQRAEVEIENFPQYRQTIFLTAAAADVVFMAGAGVK